MIKKKEFIWNTVGSMVFSVFNAITLMFCTRLNGVEIAGIFSICYATCCILNAIGDMGIRIFQVTDTKREYKYEDYFYSRIVAIVLMLIIGAIYVAITGYSNEKLFIFVILILIRVLDNFSETFQAEFQLNDRLDLAGKSLLIRNSVEMLAFIIFNKITNNIYISFGAMLLFGVFVLIFYEYRNIKKYVKERLSYNYSKVKKIVMESIPLGISTLFNMYVINAVKYAIEKYGNNEMQTYFNILYMPTFVINLVSLLLIKPFLKVFGEYWNNKEYGKFIKIIVKLDLILILCTLGIEIVCMFIGIPILNMLYKVDLTEYKMQLLLMVLSGLFYAMATVMFYALGTMRRQKNTTIAYIITSVVSMLVSYTLVNKYSMIGATLSNVIIMFFLFIALTVSFIFYYMRQKKGILQEN